MDQIVDVVIIMAEIRCRIHFAKEHVEEMCDTTAAEHTKMENRLMFYTLVVNFKLFVLCFESFNKFS